MAKGDFQKAAGVIPWQEGLPEDVIRRLRDSEGGVMRDKMNDTLKRIQDDYYTTGPPTECYCDECNAVRCDYPRWSRIWHRAAKKWRSLALLASLSWKTIIKQRDDAQADADRRLELLIRAMNALEGWRILLEFPVTDIMRDIEEELKDE